MSAQLVPINANPAPAIQIARPVILIGRHPECDVRIDSPQISRRHCCVAVAYDRLLIRDLGSRNGVRLNGLVVDEARLKPGDEVAIGQFLYRVESFLPAEPTPRSPKPGSPFPADHDSMDPIIELDDDFIPLD